MVTATAAQDIDLDQTAGTLNLGLVASTTGNAALTSAGAITDGGTGTAVVLAAADAILAAGAGIGTSSAPIEAQITVLAANAGSPGLWLVNTGSLLIGALGTVTGLGAAGAIDVTTSGTLAVYQDVRASGSILLDATGPASTGDVLSVPTGVLVQSTGSSITLEGAGNITLYAGADLSAATTVALIADNSAGNTVNLDGTLSAKTASITAGTSNGTGNDTININQLPVLVPLSVDGGGGTGNALNITGTSGNDAFTITSSEVCIQVGGSTVKSTITYSDIQLMAVNYPNPVVTGSQGGNDTFTVNGTSAATTLDCGPGNDVLNLHASVQNNAVVLNAPVDFVGGAGQNTVNVFGASIGDTIVMADESIQVVQGAAAYVAAVWGAGLQLTYSNPTEAALDFNLQTGTGTNTAYVLGTQFSTTINASSATTTNINLGGAARDPGRRGRIGHGPGHQGPGRRDDLFDHDQRCRHDVRLGRQRGDRHQRRRIRHHALRQRLRLQPTGISGTDRDQHLRPGRV